ncbi:phenylalanine--tRNA ligase subunit beta [Candidatus Shapirobacteria bacterium CG09_land_8_20_14_0_10_39_12]|uniref:Phenylalanine--tRNA ligase beta subunit n=1 Tax=Candidatus Shapirobacteria bacterium CG09_land_8_20_14_0_10_39_12 TaxID=1974885 RepID=A0A2H0WPX8_9BACT|nr:MAG: phenylalanine--tRNA ligase subunit beta [Candidatus Shapirobacteria bacterium CG09_land_8_20_14_0_10_39_12]
MNIQVSDSWLREFIDTKATPKQIGEYLSLCSQSVEKITKEGNDFIYDIEITTNRPDCLSVYGIARELSAVLPRFGIKAKLKEIPVAKIHQVEKSLPLSVKIAKNDLCPRFTALIYDTIKIKPSPAFAQKRLQNSGIRALNNVVDISNYLMLELGQPMHTFDYDKILKQKTILREAEEGEEIITLDGQTRKLHEGIIVIEDGEGRIVDLCGIMGAKNSETDENTKRVLLFVQTYSPMRIRKTCQTLGFRTEAASRFEKGIDPQGVMPAMERATLLFKDWCGGVVASTLFDVYPQRVEEKTVSVSKQTIDRVMGIDFNINEARKILDSLGFKTKIDVKKENISAVVPHFRNGDIAIPEDLVEEIARLYGYHNLPNILPPISSLNFQKDPVFDWENKIKIALKYWGFTETASYSLVSKDLLNKFGIDENDCLKISNPLTEDLVYLRTSLIPSILEIITKNKQDKINIFEMANIYLPQGENSLPDERMRLTMAVTGNSFFELKGVIEGLLYELGIKKYTFLESALVNFLQNPAEIFVNTESVGSIGIISPKILTDFNIKTPVTVCDIDLADLFKFASKAKHFTALPKYPAVIEDLSLAFPPRSPIGLVIAEIKNVDKIVKKAELIDSYQDTRTLRITFQNSEKNITDKEVKLVREKIIKKLSVKFSASF